MSKFESIEYDCGFGKEYFSVLVLLINNSVQSLVSYKFSGLSNRAVP